MDRNPKKLSRCAIYTRKSTEHNLDLEFNSLDAQREACEAYIKSQAHEGWRLIPDHYDDGAFSGASLDRPAVQSLLTEVRAGRIDIVVVYKVDRLSRSLADFAKLVELFDKYGVSFVSVTQSFNTSTSMGRLILNVLLSFAQFERELIGERVRDKIVASKRKGIWVGGPIPLGYRSIDKKLVVVPEHAERVRMIFARYLELGSIGALAQDLDRRGIRTTRRKCDEGPAGVQVPISVGALAHLLKNRFYLGDVVYRGEISRGDHEPIIDRDTFDAVQAKLASAAAARQLHLKGSSAILTGLIFDDRGNRMTPTHTNKRGARYRYYVSHALLQKRNDEAGSVSRMPAPELEALVVEALRERLHDENEGDRRAPAHDRDLIEAHVDRIVVEPEAIRIYLTDRNVRGTGNGDQVSDVAPTTASGSDKRVLMVPWSVANRIENKGVVHVPMPTMTMTSGDRDALLMAIAKSRSWIDDLLSGRTASFTDIAAREGKVECHIRLLAPLAFVSPRVVSALQTEPAPAGLTVTGLAQALPYSWGEQERRLILRR